MKGYEKNISVDLYTGLYRSVHETMQQTVSYCVFRHGCTARRIFFPGLGKFGGLGLPSPVRSINGAPRGLGACP